MQIDRLALADIPAALRLSTQAGWNQIDADWRRLVNLWPDGCFAGRVNGELVATATLATYGEVGWVGMVLVDEACRGKGFGGAIMDHVIAEADRRGIKSLGLDASDMGRPVYLKRGFVDVCPISRLVLNAPDFSPAPADVIRPSQWPQLLELDLDETGWDRRALLTHLRDEEGVRCVVAGEAGHVLAYGFRRRGRTADHIGPVVGVLGALVVTARLAMEGDGRPVIVDAFPGVLRSDGLRGLGFTVTRQLTRMYRGAAQTVSDEVLAAAGFELG